MLYVLAPGSSEALHALGGGLVRAGRTAEGQQRLEESVRRQAQDVEEQRSRRTAAMLAVQAEIHVSRGEYDAAIEAFVRRALAPDSPLLAAASDLAAAVAYHGMWGALATLPEVKPAETPSTGTA